MNEPIGDWLACAKTPKGLWMHGKPVDRRAFTKAEQAYRMMSGKGGKGLSIGYITRDSSIDKKGIRTILDVDLKEVSPTHVPDESRRPTVTAS
jgi:phage head maturation protease